MEKPDQFKATDEIPKMIKCIFKMPFVWNNALVSNHLSSFLSFLLLFSFLLSQLACQSENKQSNDDSSSLPENTLFQKLAPTMTGVDFINNVEDGKEFNVLTYRNFYNGGGVGIGDINNDGLDDLFFTANMASNQLYLNKGNLKFENISKKAGVAGQKGWSTGVSMVDINHDGWMDIYVSNSGDIAGDDRANELYINNGDLTFTEKAVEYNLDNEGFSTHASFFDYDLDGDLDAYILNNSFKDPSKLASFSKTREIDDPLGGDRLMRNDNGLFSDVSKETGIYTSNIGFGLGVSVSDLNHDYLPDIYISNDFWERDYIYMNQGDGTFSEELSDRVSICSVSSMGADIADVNNDGHFDIFTTDMLAADNHRLKVHTMFDPFYLENLKYRSSFHYQILQNCLQINDGTGMFQEVANLSEAAATDWSWGALIFDFDNDGWNDIYVCNGIYKDIMDQDFTNFIADRDEVKKIVTEKGSFDFRDFLPFLSSTPIHNYAFVNQKNGLFKNQAAALGFTEAEFSNGAAYGDLDNDGDLDLVINNVNMPAGIYENKSNEKGNHFIKIQLSEEGKNRNAIGATVKVTTSENEYYQQHYMARGFQSSVGSGLLFGLGTTNTIQSVEVVWPDKTVQVIDKPPVDQVLTIVKNTSEKVNPYSGNQPKPLFYRKEVITGNSRQQENNFNDFDFERLLPRMLSTEGPKIEIGDLNGDGLTDVLSLGAAEDVDKIFFQNERGQFERGDIPDFEIDKSYESTCAAIYDVDGDGDLDITIGSGGNKFGKGMGGFLLRQYENDGQGNFQKSLPKTPLAGGQFAILSPHDYDKDGDIDLFAGARSIPGNYGLTPRSFMLQKTGSRWQDITRKELGTAGMVTDAAWIDFDNDGDDDLMLVGEYMPITFYKNNKGEFKESVRIPDSEGWWLDITASDLDNDGDTDLVLGNWGKNTKFKASPRQPIELYVKDFDKNGKSEFILNWKAPGDQNRYPFHTKMDITEQMPSLKKRFLKYKDYADASYETLLTAQERKGAIRRKAVFLESAILRNNNGQFELEALPLGAQIAPMFASVVEDFNKDGYKDIWMSGNFYGLKPEVGRHNDSRGVLLLGQPNGSFEEAPQLTLPVKGEVRDVKILETAQNEKLMFIGINNEEITVLGWE